MSRLDLSESVLDPTLHKSMMSEAMDDEIEEEVSQPTDDLGECKCYPSLTAHQHQKGHTVPKQV